MVGCPVELPTDVACPHADRPGAAATQKPFVKVMKMLIKTPAQVYLLLSSKPPELH